MAFSMEELETCGEIWTLGGMIPKFKFPITPRENFKRVLRKEKPMWVPTYWDTQSMLPKIIPDNIARGMVMEKEGIAPEEAGGRDMFGVDWEFIPTVGGSMVRPGKPMMEDVNDWKEVIKFPNIEEWDWEGCAARNTDYWEPDKLRVIWFFTGYFERLISFMDFEAAAESLIDEDQQDAVHELFQALTDLYLKLIAKYKKYFDFDMLYLHDDWGAQRSPFFSPNTAREMIAPYIKQVIDFCHANDIYFEFHCCGKDEMLVPVMIEMGVDVWAGQVINDKKMLYDQYGDKIILGVDTPVDPEATEEEVEAAAKQNMEDFCMHFPEKAVYFCDLFPTPVQRRYQYILGRQLMEQE